MAKSPIKQIKKFIEYSDKVSHFSRKYQTMNEQKQANALKNILKTKDITKIMNYEEL